MISKRSTKKDRAPDLEREEKEFPLEVISSRISVIEDKSNDHRRNDHRIIEEKGQRMVSKNLVPCPEPCPNKVERLFDAKCGHREKKRIKEQYQRLKLKAKAEWREFEEIQNMTGGGPPPKQD